MLITKGRPNPSEPWRILEVALGQSPDVLAIRFSKEFKRLHEPSMEALVPMRRNSDGDPEWIIEHVYVRGANGSLRTLARVPGIDFLRKETADQNWIGELLKHEGQSQSTVLPVGSFVRVLTGPCARLCGNVEKVQPGTVTVAIQMRTKTVRCLTYPENLQNVQCSPDRQSFFYSSQIF